MLDALAAWELDAALEAPQRYLLRTPAIAQIAAGEASVVVGARGAGKTAASRLIVAESSPEHPAARVALKDVFLAALRPLASIDQRARASATARYIMLLTALEAMLQEQLLRGSEIRVLAREFAVSFDPTLDEALPLIFSKTLLYEVFGDPGAPVSRRGDVIDRIPALEAAIARALGRRRALVMFDEAADRSVVAGALDPLRVAALLTLLAGVGDLMEGPAGGAVIPVVFTRPGLFARLPLRERESWNGRRLDLTWTSRELRAAAAHRIARAADPKAPPKSAPAVFQRFLTEASQGLWPSGDAAWDVIWTRSRARPRDMVFFLRAIARNVRHRVRHGVDAESFLQAEKTYAAFLRQDMADEIRDVAPDIEDLLDGIARHRKARLSAPELVEVIEEALAGAHSAEAIAGARGTIERFFEASAIGNLVSEGRGVYTRFVHDDPEATFDYEAPVVIHPGLASALDLDLEVAA